jgi:Ca-activated chloride channel family protein
MFRFAHPEYLYGLYFVPVLIAAFWYSIRRRSRLIDQFAGKTLQPVLLPTFSKGMAALRPAIIVMAVILLLIAASDPQIGTKIENVKEKGIDIYALLDVSLSMQAQDIKPSRLDKAKLELSNLLPRLRGDRIGLIVFAGEPFVQFPLTSDYSAADLFLSAANVNSVPEQGTAIAPAINLALNSFEVSSKNDPSDKAEQVIVIFSDGGDHEGHIQEAIDRAKKDHVKIYTVGFGSPDGAPIPIYNDQGQQIGFKKDDKGNIVLAKLHATELQQIASGTGGKFFRAANGRDELELIYGDLSKIRKSELGEKRVTDYEDRFYYFLAPAIMLLLLEFFMSERRSRLLGKLNEKLGTVQ